MWVLSMLLSMEANSSISGAEAVREALHEVNVSKVYYAPAPYVHDRMEGGQNTSWGVSRDNRGPLKDSGPKG